MRFKHIREATKDEIDQVESTLSENLYNEYYFHFFSTDYTVDMTGTNNGFGWKWMTIMDDNEKTVGIIQIARQRIRENAKLGFLVYEKHSEKRYGTRAIKETIKLCWDIGVNNIILETTSKRLCKYYEKQGFKHVGTMKNEARLPNWEVVDRYYLQLLKDEQSAEK